MICTKCKKEVKDSLIFCPVCGNELHKKENINNDYFHRCPICGKEYLCEMNHCIECGYKTKAYDSQMLKLKEDMESNKHKKCIPQCPTCRSTNLKRITATQKASNAVLFVLFGNKRKKQFHCNNCGYEW